MLLSVSLDCLCGRRWWAFKGAGLPMQAFRYFLPQGSLSTRPDSRALAADLLLTLWYKPHCLKCHQPYIPHCCQPWTWNPAAYHSLAPFLWYLILAEICERYCKSSIFWAIQVCKLVCLPGIILKKDQETWLSAYNSTCYWRVCYLARLYRLGHSFMAWYLYYWLAFKAHMRSEGFVGRRSSIFGA